MADKTYNGWTNYETWNVALWIDNDAGSHEYRNEMVRDCWKNAKATNYSTRKQAAVRDLAEALKQWISEDERPDLGATLYADLLGAALSEVDWHEIAENFLDDVDEELEVDEDDSDDDE